VRAQVIENPERLDFIVRSGKASVLAERILTVPGSFTLEIKHKVSPVKQLEDVRVQFQCAKTGEIFFDQPLTRSPSRYSIGTMPSECAAVRLSFLARAWSDKPNLRGTIYSVRMDSK
tara:strand:- start:494 stop:844 length:351 start_codon:yes stop_codon:yes gene_type:complete